MTHDQEATMPEPLEMTLEEALIYIARHRAGMQQDDPDYDARIEPRVEGGWLGANKTNSGYFATWPEAFRAVLRVAVVERDDKAELVEALQAILRKVSAYLASMGGDGDPITAQFIVPGIAADARAALAAVGEGEA